MLCCHLQAKKANFEVSAEFQGCLEKLQMMMGTAVMVEALFVHMLELQMLIHEKSYEGNAWEHMCKSICACFIDVCIPLIISLSFSQSWFSHGYLLHVLWRLTWATASNPRRRGRVKMPSSSTQRWRCNLMLPRSYRAWLTSQRCWGQMLFV